MNTIRLSNKWKYTIGIKHLFKDTVTPESVAKISKIIESKLKSIITSIENASNINEDEKDYFINELEDVRSHFEFMQHLTDGTIPEDEFQDYEYEESECESLFNEYLRQLYDLADKRIIHKSNVSEKLIWIG